MGSFGNLGFWVLLICMAFQSVFGFYLPGSYPHKYKVGDPLSVKVNSLTLIDTEIPYKYYSLPFCKPKEGVKDSDENLGEFLMDDRIENSPYRLKMFKNETEILLCKTNPLSADEYKLFTTRIDEMYQVNVIIDNLPAIRYTKRDDLLLRWTGYPVGVKVENAYYVLNHLKFTVLVHKYDQSPILTGSADGLDMIPEAGGSAKLGTWLLVSR
ncbi:hypothetical protein RND81_05G141100 [Saponaria officinalis]|uniref:Transmembrane 9 superfamily member n=1 Tax=Saponaria officinalis TaxID=3572 RepID=A0AAW1KXZ2_SAPOF